MNLAKFYCSNFNKKCVKFDAFQDEMSHLFFLQNLKLKSERVNNYHINVLIIYVKINESFFLENI